MGYESHCALCERREEGGGGGGGRRDEERLCSGPDDSQLGLVALLLDHIGELRPLRNLPEGEVISAIVREGSRYLLHGL